jgi:hypothetical protein
MNSSTFEEKLAVGGGVPARKTPFARWPQFEVDEIEAATRVLLSGKVNYWTGEEGRRFEEALAAQAGLQVRGRGLWDVWT